MTKKEISWIGVVKVCIDAERKKGNSPSIKDVMPQAKKRWTAIKNGSDPDYVKGAPPKRGKKSKSKSKGKKSKATKTKKVKKSKKSRKSRKTRKSRKSKKH